MRWLRSALFVAAGVMAGWWMGVWATRPTRGAEAISYHTGVTVEQVRALSSLVTAKVDVSDVQETRLEGYTGGVKAALLVKGDFLLGVDLSQARFESVDDAKRTAVLVLPQPKAASPRLDHARTRVYSVVETGLWQVTPGSGKSSTAVIDLAYRDAQQFVAEAAKDPALVARSRTQAESVLAAFFRATGWTVQIRWAS